MTLDDSPTRTPADGHLADLSGAAEDRLEQLFDEFEAAWTQGLGPRIEDYLPGEDSLRRPALIEMLYIDQEYAIRGGSAATVEGYLGRFPGLADDPDLVLELAAREFRHRCRRGDAPSIGEYLGRFPEIADRLGRRLGAEPGRPTPGTTLVEDPGPAEGLPPPPPLAPSGERRPGYDRIRLHARGGMGDVYRAFDVELAREVALKRIRPEFAGQARVRRRFLREARLTARLDHPGVVPIHGLLRDDDGQPWYVMRFVEGRTLARAIDDHHASVAEGAHPEDLALAFRQLLARFVAVCDTVAFAHSRGVIHRDLKPSNVILGQFGETVVLDWGLATTSEAGPDPSGSDPGDPGPAADADPVTLPGLALGTPPFMSPEQAAGLPDRNRPACDVFGLGAILYMILTGRSPYPASGWPANRGEVILGRFPGPRQLRPDAPRALEAICLKATAREPSGRYATAGDLARDVERWEADEPVTAWAEPLAPRARRWARGHRTAVAAGLASGLASLIGLAVVTSVQTRANRDLAAGNRDLARSNALAEDRFDLALDAIRSFRSGVTEAEMLGQPELRGLRDKLLRSASDFHERLEGLLRGQPDRKSLGTLGRSYFELGGLIAEVGAKPEALAAHRKGLAVRRALATPDDPRSRADLGLSLIAVGKLAKQTGDHPSALAAFEEARDLAATLVLADPSSVACREILAASHHDLGSLLAESGDPAVAMNSFRSALAEYGRIVAENPASLPALDELSNVHNGVGIHLEGRGDLAGALVEHGKAMEIRERLVAASPDTRAYRHALAGSLNNIAKLKADALDLDAAMSMQRRALDLFAGHSAALPADTEARRNLGIGHENLGVIRSRSGDPAGAILVPPQGPGAPRGPRPGRPRRPGAPGRDRQQPPQHRGPAPRPRRRRRLAPLAPQGAGDPRGAGRPEPRGRPEPPGPGLVLDADRRSTGEVRRPGLGTPPGPAGRGDPRVPGPGGLAPPRGPPRAGRPPATTSG